MFNTLVFSLPLDRSDFCDISAIALRTMEKLAAFLKTFSFSFPKIFLIPSISLLLSMNRRRFSSSRVLELWVLKEYCFQKLVYFFKNENNSIFDTLPVFDSVNLLPFAVHEKSKEDSSILKIFPELPFRLDPLELLPALLGVVPDPVPCRLPGHLHACPAHGGGT